MSSIEGYHQNTGHEWHLFQCINFTYLPRNMRRRFLNKWLKELDKPGQIKFRWKKEILPKYPYLKPAIRRYLFKPTYYIKNLQEIPLSEVEKVVISTFPRDFSKKITTILSSPFRHGLSLKSLFKRNKKKAKGKR